MQEALKLKVVLGFFGRAGENRGGKLHEFCEVLYSMLKVNLFLLVLELYA